MANNIINIRDNYIELKEILLSRYEEVNGLDFYRYIFPNNENKGESNTDYSKPNAIYLYEDDKDNGSERRVRRRIMLNATYEDYLREEMSKLYDKFFKK